MRLHTHLTWRAASQLEHEMGTHSSVLRRGRGDCIMPSSWNMTFWIIIYCTAWHIHMIKNEWSNYPEYLMFESNSLCDVCHFIHHDRQKCGWFSTEGINWHILAWAKECMVLVKFTLRCLYQEMNPLTGFTRRFATKMTQRFSILVNYGMFYGPRKKTCLKSCVQFPNLDILTHLEDILLYRRTRYTLCHVYWLIERVSCTAGSNVSHAPETLGPSSDFQKFCGA